MNKEIPQMQSTPTYIERLALGLAIFAAGCLAVAGAVKIIGFGVFTDENVSARAAAWVQAIASPLAIAAAFFVARYQANRQDATAAEQRRIDAVLAEEQKREAAARSKGDSLEVEASSLVFAYGALILVAAQVAAILKVSASMKHERIVEQSHADQFWIAISPLVQFDQQKISNPTCQLTFATAARAVQIAGTTKRAAVGQLMHRFRPCMEDLIPPLVMAVDSLEGRIHHIGDMLHELGREPISPFELFDNASWATEWRSAAPGILERLRQHPTVVGLMP